MGGGQPAPINPSDVLILDSAPDWPYKRVGLVQSQGTSYSKDISVFKGLQEETAKIGAPAVIVEQNFMDYSATPYDDGVVGAVLKGTAISPVRLDGRALEQWKRARAAAGDLRRKRPSVQTIGQ
jgi:hypothetical protein